MKNASRKFCISVCFIVFMMITVLLAIRGIVGQNIEHFKQYILPCSGRIVVLSDTPATVSFAVLDEQELSEFAKAENIRSISLYDSNGFICDADSWTISEAGFYQGNAFSAKTLNVTFTTSKAFHLSQIEIEYTDQSEVFMVGDLEIYMFEKEDIDSYLASTQIWSSPLSLSNITYSTDVDLRYDQNIPSALYIDAKSFRSGFIIKNIDLGIDGLGTKLNAVKYFEGSIDIGQAFFQDSTNEPFWLGEVVPELCNSDLNILIEATEDEVDSVFIGLEHTVNFSDELNVRYYSPIYTCIDLETNQEYVYADYGYHRDIPYLKKDSFAQQLLEEFGQ